MNIDVLYEYIEITKHDSLSAAAAAMHMDASTLSRHLTNLERHYGAKLIARSRRAASVPTEAGKVLLEHATAICEHFKQAEKDITSLASSEDLQL